MFFLRSRRLPARILGLSIRGTGFDPLREHQECRIRTKSKHERTGEGMIWPVTGNCEKKCSAILVEHVSFAEQRTISIFIISIQKKSLLLFQCRGEDRGLRWKKNWTNANCVVRIIISMSTDHRTVLLVDTATYDADVMRAGWRGILLQGNGKQHTKRNMARALSRTRRFERQAARLNS